MIFAKRMRGDSQWFERGDVDTYDTPFDFQSIMMHPPHLTRQFSKTGDTRIIDYIHPLIEEWPDRDIEMNPLSTIDVVHISLAYQCTISQKDMVQYIHMNRYSTAQQVSTLEKTLMKMNEEIEKLKEEVNPAFDKANRNYEETNKELNKTKEKLRELELRV